MASDSAFDDLVDRLRAGSDEAATEIFQRYTRQLVALARTRLGPRIGQKECPEDLVQSVYKSFFVRFAEGRLSLDGWGGLWGMLVRIAQRKCGHRIEKYLAAKRDVRREREPSAEESASWLEPIAREPSPEEAALLVEALDGVLRQLRSDREREVVALRLQEYTISEIARQLGCGERTVHRVLAKVRGILEAGLEPAASS